MTAAIEAHVRRHDAYRDWFEFDDGVFVRRMIEDPTVIDFTPVEFGYMTAEEVRNITLLTGVAARLAHRAGRVTADGSVTLSIPVNERTAGDTRANAITNVDITVDPAPATTDLHVIRAAAKQALIRSKDEPDTRWALLPLVPLLSEVLTRRLVGVATGGTTNVVASNLGATPPPLNHPDGSDADSFTMKSL